MATLLQFFNWGSNLRNQNPELVRQLDSAYNNTAVAINSKVTKYVTDGRQLPHVDPPANSQFNENFEIGDIYVRPDTDTAWIMTSRVDATNVTWKPIT